MKDFAIIVAFIALTLVLDCFYALWGKIIINWVLSLFGIAFSVSFWQVFAVLFVISFIKQMLK